MIEPTIIESYKLRKIEPLIKILGLFLPVIGVIIACIICILLHMPIKIEKPYILLLGSLLILVPFKNKTIKTVQNVSVFYLISIPVNQLSSQFFSIPILKLYLSYSTIVLFLCILGYAFWKLSSTSVVRKKEYINFSWLLAIAILVFHMILLIPVMKKFYGFGHEHNINTMGQLCLYFLLFVVLWERLNELRLRQISGLILTLFYLIAIFLS